MDFEEYLYSKKIDSAAFKMSEGREFSQLKEVFDQTHPDSFTSQKLFLINPLRRKYNWKEKIENERSKSIMKTKIAKPKI